MATKAEIINGKLKDLYSKNLDIFKDIPKYSTDYSYPSFINCTDEFANSKTKALFVDWESAVWYRDRDLDEKYNRNELSYNMKSAPWAYNKYDQDVDGYMKMYSDFSGNDCINKDVSKSKFWSISALIAKTMGVPYLFSYIMKSDVNYPRPKGFGLVSQQTPEYRKMCIWRERFETECHEILAEEIKILKPNYVFFFRNSRFGKGEMSLPMITGSRIEYIPVGDNGILTFVEQNRYKNTEMFLINSSTFVPEEIKMLKKSLELLQFYA